MKKKTEPIIYFKSTSDEISIKIANLFHLETECPSQNNHLFITIFIKMCLIFRVHRFVVIKTTNGSTFSCNVRGNFEKKKKTLLDENS